jgi:hypothetical protein
MGMYYKGGAVIAHTARLLIACGGGGGGASTHPCPTYNQMHAGFSFSYPPISVLLRQPLSIKKSYAGAVHALTTRLDLLHAFLLSSFLAPSLSPVNFHSSTVSCNAEIMTKRKIRKVLRQLRRYGGGLRIPFSVIGQCSLVPTSHWL